MTALDEAIEDLDYYLVPDRLAAADPGDLRRALYGAMDALYRLRNGRIDELGSNEYWARADANAAGQTVRAITAVRGKLAHRLSTVIAPRPAPLLPGLNTYPGARTIPGENLTWIASTEIDALLKEEDASAYRSRLQGQIVGYSFDTARDFLVNLSI